jgi:rhodanese-related sulfurtransferase
MSYVVIDVREPVEYQESHIEGAINIPPSDLMSGAAALADTPKDANIILYCISGSRSNSAQHILAAQGFTNLTNGINQQQVSAKYGLSVTG